MIYAKTAAIGITVSWIAGHATVMVSSFTRHDSRGFRLFKRYFAPRFDRFEGIGSEPISDVIKSGSEPGFGVIAVAFARWCVFAENVGGGASGPAEGKRDGGHEQPAPDRSRKRPPFVKPRLATLAAEAPEGDDWLH